MSTQTFKDYEEFWPFYVSEHLDPTCRNLHFAGTSLAMLLAANPLTLPLAPVAGYGFAWAGHFIFEKNRPATFKHPLWSLRGDFRMWKKMLLKQMDAEIDKARALYPDKG
jgi:hypothetical protein